MPKIIGDMTLYTVLELSKLLDVTEVTLRRYIKDGKLHARIIGGGLSYQRGRSTGVYRQARAEQR